MSTYCPGGITAASTEYPLSTAVPSVKNRYSYSYYLNESSTMSLSTMEFLLPIYREGAHSSNSKARTGEWCRGDRCSVGPSRSSASTTGCPKTDSTLTPATRTARVHFRPKTIQPATAAAAVAVAAVDVAVVVAIPIAAPAPVAIAVAVSSSSSRSSSISSSSSSNASAR